MLIMSKVFLFCISLFVTVSGFSAPRVPMARLDTSAAVEEALKKTATFGIDSDEARVAWDIVEEMDASDNSEAMQPGLDKECVIENTSAECLDYGRFLDELFNVRDMITPRGENKKAHLIDVLKAIKVTSGEGKPVKSSPELTKALEEAKKATADFGVSSVEARLAWETYEEIASTGLDNSLGISLSEECSIEAGEEACKAIEELERVLPVLISLDLK